MSEVKALLVNLFRSNNVIIPANRMGLLDQFLEDEENKQAIQVILENQQRLMAKWKWQNRSSEIIQQPVRVLNATVGKPYETRFDIEQLGWKDITSFKFEGLEEAGLHYDHRTKQITGIPTHSGDRKIVFKFGLEGQPEETPLNEKTLTLIINPDPKSLWKNVPSDKNDPYWKPDDVTIFEKLGDRHILASSKRGRSHANVGSFREDDFSYKDLENGWSIVVVSDGAGSAKISRKGSALACNAVVEYFSLPETTDAMREFDDLLQQQQSNTGDEIQKKINRFVYNHIGKGALYVHKQLAAFAATSGVTLKDLSSTLIFTLFKKYEAGYALLSFGVGDCPIAVLNKDRSEVILMNWIDVGEFGGGTRFITMPEIFQNEKFSTRMSFKMIPDFSYLVLMSDGIYDPKFVVEANLPNIKKWQEFFQDLNGKNEDGSRVILDTGNEDIINQFSTWMDFWSAGNHDDRTLAIVF